MARDFNPANPATSRPAAGNRSADKRGGMPPMFAGILIGLLLGVMLAVGVAIWLNRANNPFVDKSPPVETLPAFTARSPLPPVTKSEKGDADKPRFEFYQILPGDKSGAERATVAPASPAKPPPSSDPRVALKSETSAPREAVKPVAVETVYLQAGAFQSQSDAENLKAKIAFSGFEAYIRQVNLPDKGTLYRVRLGPYKSPDEVNRIKATLSQNGIAAAVVKTAD